MMATLDLAVLWKQMNAAPAHACLAAVQMAWITLYARVIQVSQEACAKRSSAAQVHHCPLMYYNKLKSHNCSCNFWKLRSFYPAFIAVSSSGLESKWRIRRQTVHSERFPGQLEWCLYHVLCQRRGTGHCTNSSCRQFPFSALYWWLEHVRL